MSIVIREWAAVCGRALREVVWYIILFWPLGISIASAWVAPLGIGDGARAFLGRTLVLMMIGGGMLIAHHWTQYLFRDGRSYRVRRRLRLDRSRVTHHG